MEQVKITYLGHACFRLEYDNWRIVLDPYDPGSVPGLPHVNEEAEAVYCSHTHYDHGNVSAVKLCEAKSAQPYGLEEIVTPHDDQGGSLRGMNTVRIFSFGTQKLAHMGDVGRALLPEEIEKLKGIDCMLIPVGGHYTIDSPTAAEMIAQVQPKVVIPMHYRTDDSGFDIISHINDFTKLFDNVNTCGDTFVLTKDAPAQTLVMSHKK